MSMMRLVRGKPGKTSSVLLRARALRGDALVVKTLLAQVLHFPCTPLADLFVSL